MDTEEKNFSGHKWTGSGRMRRMRKLAGTAECNGRREKEEGKDGRSTKVGRLRIVTAAGLRGPGGQDAKQRGARRSFPKGEKRYLAMCDSNNESEFSRTRASHRDNVNVISVCAISSRALD